MPSVWLNDEPPRYGLFPNEIMNMANGGMVKDENGLDTIQALWVL